MGAGLVRLLGIAWSLAVAAAALAAPSSAAPFSTPVLIRIPTPNPRTAAFEKCMTGAAAAPAVPSAARCLADMGLARFPQLREQTAVCLSQRGVLRTVCLNGAFDAIAPVSVASPGPTPPPAATPTPPPTRRPTRRPTPTPAPSPLPTTTSTPAPVPTSTPTPESTATAGPSPEPTSAPTPAPTRAVTAVPTSSALAALPPTPLPQPTPPPTAAPTPVPAFPIDAPATALAAGGLGAALAGVAGVVLIRRNRRKQKGRPQMHRLTIAAPADGSIAVAGIPVTFTAQTDPPSLANTIAWSVTTQPNVHGIGPSFTHTFAATGVEHVVARLGDDALACDAIVYVFKTPSGGTTLADVLRAEPPPVARSASAFTRYGTSASAPGRAS